MPELPEVETIKRDLEREVIGKRIKTVEVSGTRSIRRGTKKQFISRLEGAKVTGVQRKGKYLILKMDTGDLLVVHLRMSGQLLKAVAKDPVAKHTHVTLTFTPAGQLRFLDPRTFGEMFVSDPDHLAEDAPELADLGFDPLDEPISWIDFGRMLIAKPVQLKAFLMDQHLIAGIGNIYSDEILYAAGLRYDRMTDTLTTQDIRRLYRAVVEVVHEAVKHRGSSLADEQYRDLFGRVGGYQNEHQAYGREGLACRRCRSTIERAKYQGRSTFYCPSCQV